MDIIEIRNYCLAKPYTEESMPFDDKTLVIKVMNRMFILISLDKPISPTINIKCDPDIAVDLRERHSCVAPGYHMNKTLWNTITLDGSVSNKLIAQWIDHSYEEVIKTLTKKQQLEIADLRIHPLT